MQKLLSFIETCKKGGRFTLESQTQRQGGFVVSPCGVS